MCYHHWKYFNLDDYMPAPSDWKYNDLDEENGNYILSISNGKETVSFNYDDHRQATMYSL